MAKFNLKLVGTNKDGSRIFAVLTYGKKRLLKGFYDFDTENFTILNYYKKNFTEGIGKGTVNKVLKNILEVDRNWNVKL